MPPRIRTRASKALKENINSENKVKNIKSNTKVPRKVLADKTNSTSDDTSGELTRKEKPDVRSRRDRRLPSRFVENPVILSTNRNASENVTTTVKNNTPMSTLSAKSTPVKNKDTSDSPFKTPSKVETSLVVNRPRRICRLPSRFDDHSISPSKYIPIQPTNSSTPNQSKGKPAPQAVAQSNAKSNKNLEKKETSHIPTTRSAKTAALQKKILDNSSSDKSSPDSNNNAKAKVTKAKKTQPEPLTPKKISPKLNNSNSIKKFFNRTASPAKVIPKPLNNRKIRDVNNSFKVLGGKNKSREKDVDDVYEFTFDPTEEPQKQKKKRKKPATKKPGVPKAKATIKYKSTYDQNISKALSALKKIVKPTASAQPEKLSQIQETNEVVDITQGNNLVTSNVSTGNREYAPMDDTGKTSVHECNYPSIRVEDIAADIEPSVEHYDDINYSPVNSPRCKTPVPNVELDSRQCPERPILSKDPLNLQEDLSFFDDVPVASSSMNMSVRHPLASPWRVEFGNLPIKWHSNTYIKPNMTPAVESSFICSEEDNKKKHVYTNMVPETNDSLPQIVSNTPNLKQPSIISFIKEVAERKAKKKRGRSVSPTKLAAVVDNIENNTSNLGQTEDMLSNKEPAASNSNSAEVSGSSNNLSSDKENSKVERKTRKRKNNENICDRPTKSPRKQKDKDCTYFGFDESESQENVSPIKVKNNIRGRSLRSKSRAVLQEINGPSRAALPIAAKSKTATSSEAINRAYEEIKSAADAPVFPEKNVEENVTNVEDPSLMDDSQSVHLFEDIEVVHHLKATRKSYGKAKKVTFRQHSTSDSESQEPVVNQNDTSFEDDLADLTFEVPNVKERKKTKKKPKKLMSKKEEKEAEEWAAGFNSMCEEIEDFPLVVE